MANKTLFAQNVICLTEKKSNCSPYYPYLKQIKLSQHLKIYLCFSLLFTFLFCFIS